MIDVPWEQYQPVPASSQQAMYWSQQQHPYQPHAHHQGYAGPRHHDPGYPGPGYPDPGYLGSGYPGPRDRPAFLGPIHGAPQDAAAIASAVDFADSLITEGPHASPPSPEEESEDGPAPGTEEDVELTGPQRPASGVRENSSQGGHLGAPQALASWGNQAWMPGPQTQPVAQLAGYVPAPASNSWGAGNGYMASSAWVPAAAERPSGRRNSGVRYTTPQASSGPPPAIGNIEIHRHVDSPQLPTDMPSLPSFAEIEAGGSRDTWRPQGPTPRAPAGFARSGSLPASLPTVPPPAPTPRPASAPRPAPTPRPLPSLALPPPSLQSLQLALPPPFPPPAPVPAAMAEAGPDVGGLLNLDGYLSSDSNDNNLPGDLDSCVDSHFGLGLPPLAGGPPGAPEEAFGGALGAGPGLEDDNAQTAVAGRFSPGPPPPDSLGVRLATAEAAGSEVEVGPEERGGQPCLEGLRGSAAAASGHGGPVPAQGRSVVGPCTEHSLAQGRVKRLPGMDKLTVFPYTDSA